MTRPNPGFAHRIVRPLLRCLALGAALATGPARAQEDVPFLTTPDNVTQAMLALAGVGPRDHVIDLGSGDGRIVITAAKRHGATGLGVEIVADLVRQSQAHAQRAGVADKVQFKEQDLFATDLRPATVVTMYLLQSVNLQLRPRLLELAPGTRLVSHDWDMGDWQPDRSLQLAVPDKQVGRDKSSRVHLWVVPARVQGLWCAGEGSLQLTQRFQTFSATLTRAGETTPVRVFDGRIEATRLLSHDGQLALEASATGLQITRVDPTLAFGAQGFQRATGTRCG
jgi:ribosomal protein L11 methylase PrmA